MSVRLDRLLPAPLDGGFRQEGYWVWCGSPCRDDEGLFHLFASRWPACYPMHPGWTFHSEIVRAVSERPEGPYRFEEVVFARRDPAFFDGRMTHNPTIHRHGDTWLLFYTGCTYADEPPSPEEHPDQHDRYYAEVWNNKRIGLATAPHPSGPWTRRDAPILEPRSGAWDCSITSNPAPCVLADGRVLLVYKSSARSGAYGGPFFLGLAGAEHWSGPYRRLSEEPILHFAAGCHVEDPYLWHDDSGFHLIMKDMTGGLCGEAHAGIHALSDDARHWRLAEPPLAYSRSVRWADDSTRRMGSFERPQLLFQDGVPTHLFAATADGPGTFQRASTTWTICVPLG